MSEIGHKADRDQFLKSQKFSFFMLTSWISFDSDFKEIQ